jgi:hypothetical protein
MAKEKTQKYKVKSTIQYGVRADDADPTDRGAVTTETYELGDTIELTDAEAHEMRHALLNPPPMKLAALDTNEDPEEMDEDEEEALESIRRRPDNPASGVQQHWKTDRAAVDAANRATAAASAGRTKATGGGFERESADAFSLQSAGLNSPGTAHGPRPDSNKTDMEKEEEKQVQKSQEKDRKDAEKKAAETKQ